MCNLYNDVTVGEAYDQAVLGGLVLVLVLGDQTLCNEKRNKCKILSSLRRA